MIVWDETKRKRNRRNHGIDLADVGCVFDAPMVTVEDKRKIYGEPRLHNLGWFRDRIIFLGWPERDDCARVISCRYGDKHETRICFKTLGI